MPLQRWPVFICYRRVDGAVTARRLHEILVGQRIATPDGAEIEIDPYLDETMPGVADWKKLHRPYLEKARALIVICTPGARIDEGDDDWVHREIDWWVANRGQAPLLVDPLGEGARYVPAQILERWPDIQRISLSEREWASLPEAQLKQKAEALRRQVVGAILPSGAAIYEEELERERARAEQLELANRKSRRGLRISLGLLAGVVVASAVAISTLRQSSIKDAIAGARLLDYQADEQFRLVRQLVAQRAVARERRMDLLAQIEPQPLTDDTSPSESAASGRLPSPDTAGPSPPALPAMAAGQATQGGPSPAQGALRRDNLRAEIAQFDREIGRLSDEAATARNRGTQLLSEGDAAWQRIVEQNWASPRDVRNRPVSPDVFSVEILAAGYGESILIHYGPIDSPRLILVNTGPRSTYRMTLAPRLRELSSRDYGGRPVPIDLVAIGDQDEEKSGGLSELLADIGEATPTQPAPARVQLIWANMFRYGDSQQGGLRNRLRSDIQRLGLRLNAPFGSLIMRPPRGPLLHRFEGGMTVMVLGPTRERLQNLHSDTADWARERGAEIEPFPEGRPAASREGFQLAASTSPVPPDSRCRPGQLAAQYAGGAYSDASASNLASTILLFQFGNRTFLHTGDARGDIIIEGLGASGLLDAQGRAHVDLMNIPHFGSRHNSTPEFFARVRAGTYLVTGNGRFGNPAIEVLAGLIARRPCEDFRMIFTTRDYQERRPRARPLAPEATDPFFAPDRANPSRVPENLTLDAFFAEDARNNPRYRREFLSPRRGSIFVDLLEPLLR